jgi:hypothetical protein
MGRKPILPTQAQRRLLGLIVGGMAIERTGPVAYLLGPEPGREYLTRVSVATFEKLRALGWLKPAPGANRWTISTKGRRVFDSGGIRT